MSDHELLELAAKAAGYGGIINFGGQPGVMMPCNPVGASRHQPWNPLTSDGDALRLVVKLKMEVDCEHDPICAGMQGDDFFVGIREPVGDDPRAATRRAIVRAAAEIGKEPPPEGRG